ncbi:MAG: CGNR zinc finger domain-containing protein, partial [Acetobacteraceae bacterium]
MGRPPAIFVGDARGLDFLNSIARPIDTPIDWLEDGEGLLSWLEQARLAPADALKSIAAHALPGELDNVATQARSLREWFRGFVRRHKGRPLAAGDLAQLQPLNRLLERDQSFSRIVSQSQHGSDPLQLQMVRRWQTPEALLLPIGEALARLLCSEDFSYVKACENPACTLLFADH